MITILLVNLIGVTIYVAGIGLCLRTTKRTGNHGYLLLAAYFAAVLVVSSMDQVRRMQAGPVPVEILQPEVASPTGSVPETPDATPMANPETPQLTGDSSVPEDETKSVAVVPDSPWESVSPPILPALLLAGVFLVARDDPRRHREDPESDGEPPVADEGAGAVTGAES